MHLEKKVFQQLCGLSDEHFVIGLYGVVCGGVPEGDELRRWVERLREVGRFQVVKEFIDAEMSRRGDVGGGIIVNPQVSCYLPPE